MFSIPKCRGTVIKDAVSALKRASSRVEIPEHLAAYLRNHVDLMDWYPASDLTDIMRLVLKVHPLEREAALRSMGRTLAEVHLSGIYAPDMRGDLSVAIPKLWRAQHDTGAMSCAITKSEVRFDLIDWQQRDRDLCCAFTGYLEVTLEYAELEIGRLEKVACTHEGARGCGWVAPFRHVDDEERTDPSVIPR